MDRLAWPFEPLTPRAEALPARIVTRAPMRGAGALDPLTALLLPAGGGAGTVPRGDGPRDCVGLWLGTPFPPPPPEGAGWVCNFPPALAFDDAFRGELAEVGLGPEREAAHLARLRGAGLRTMLAGTVGAPVFEGAEADALLIAVRGPDDLEALRTGHLADLRARLGRDVPCAVLAEEGGALPRRPAQDGFDAVLRAPQLIP